MSTCILSNLVLILVLSQFTSKCFNSKSATHKGLAVLCKPVKYVRASFWKRQCNHYQWVAVLFHSLKLNHPKCLGRLSIFEVNDVNQHIIIRRPNHSCSFSKLAVLLRIIKSPWTKMMQESVISLTTFEMHHRQIFACSPLLQLKTESSTSTFCHIPGTDWII